MEYTYEISRMDARLNIEYDILYTHEYECLPGKPQEERAFPGRHAADAFGHSALFAHGFISGMK